MFAYSDSAPIGPPSAQQARPRFGPQMAAPGYLPTSQRRPPMPQMQMPQQMPGDMPVIGANGFPQLPPAQISQLRELLNAQGAGSVDQPRSLMSARGKSGAAALTAANLIEPRVSHLEDKLKECIDRLSSMMSDSDAKFGFVKAKTLLETEEFVSTEADPHVAVLSAQPTTVAAGTELSLSYPQAEVTIDGENKIVMRRRVVDPDSAQITMSWLVVYFPDASNNELDVSYVGDFAV